MASALLRGLIPALLAALLLAGPALAADDLLSGFDERPQEAKPGQTAPPTSGGDDLMEGLGQEAGGSAPAASGGGDLMEGLGQGADQAAPAAGKGDTDLLEGLDQGKVDAVSSATPPSRRGQCRLSGTVTQSAAVNYAHEAPPPGGTDWRGLSRFRSELDLRLDIKLPGDWKARLAGRGFYDWAYLIRGRDNFTDDTLAAMEWEAEPREVYLQGELAPGLDLKLGRQVVVWGKADNIRVVDVLNPLDQREPGMVDIEDLRLPTTMIKADYYFGSWSLTGIVIPELRFNKNPPFGSDFYPGARRLEEIKPGMGLDNLEYALALSGVFSGWDLSLHFAHYFDRAGHYAWVPNPFNLPLVELKHSRLTMLGAAANLALGNWLVKAETAWLNGLEFMAAPDEKFNRLDGMLGLEYSGFSDTTISVEWAARWLTDYQTRLKSAPDQADETDFTTMIRLTRDFDHDTWKLTGLIGLFGLGFQGGGFVRLQLDYDIADGWELTVGVIDYIAGSARPWGMYGDNDRVFASLAWSF